MTAANPSTEPLTLAELREKLAARGPGAFWRSLDELAETPEFVDYLQREFPRAASEWNDSFSRRRFLQLMGASLVLAAAQGCTRQDSQSIVPYVEAPRDFKPGQVGHFATAMSRGGYGIGLLVESHDGRPTKVDGNPSHPYSLGASDVFAQASILGLYDPDRSQTVLHNGRISTWDELISETKPLLEKIHGEQGEGLRILTGATSSPTLIAQIKDLLKQLPKAQWHLYEPCGAEHHGDDSSKADEKAVEAIYDLQQAKRILAVDVDFLASTPDSLPLARQYAARRREKSNLTAAEMTRLYTAAPAPNCTTAMADHRLPLRASQCAALLPRIAEQMGVTDVPKLAALSAQQQAWADAVAADLKEHGSQSVVILGDSQSADVRGLAVAINRQLGSDKQDGCVQYYPAVLANAADGAQRIDALVADLNAKKVRALVILGGNPVYDAPADLDFAAAFRKSGAAAIRLSMYVDETSQLCSWHVPTLHELESWTDLRAIDGTASIVQPLIDPLYSTAKSAHDVLGLLPGEKAPKTAYDRVREYWTTWHKGKMADADFDVAWANWLKAGVVADSANQPTAAPKLAMGETKPPSRSSKSSSLEIVFQPDPAVWDGRYANNGWLQELPRTISKLTWGNVASLSPATADRLGVSDGDVVTLKLGERSVEAPVLRVPGHADDCVSVTLGYGRTHAGHVGNGVGFDAYSLRTSDAPHFAAGVELTKTGKTIELATTQHHHNMEGRAPVRVGDVAEFEQKPHFLQREFDLHAAPSLLPNYEYSGYAWGMSIDLNSCMGCNACVVACQSENNIPIVGPEQIRKGREMHWLRIDSYYHGDELDNPEILFQPLACQHCEHAPCELVCPVAATTHSAEGLNEMTYNRCVGTRYCSNNCPYKVRRFNFLEFVDSTTPVLKLMRNPEVTVRSRGVMEKCTYCVQRISAARITAKKEDRAIRDGEIVTACQAACPAQAIVFGDLNDPKSAVNARKNTPLNYQLLSELNTLPRTTYTGRLVNPNPALAKLEKQQASITPLDSKLQGAS